MPFGSFNKNPRDRKITVAGIFYYARTAYYFKRSKGKALCFGNTGRFSFPFNVSGKGVGGNNSRNKQYRADGNLHRVKRRRGNFRLEVFGKGYKYRRDRAYYETDNRPGRTARKFA